MSTPAIHTDGLTRRFATGIALDRLTLDAAAGEVLALLGPNGAGKTTTMRLLNGVLRPDAGSASVLGLDPSRSGDELRRRTGVLTEAAGLDERFTALENLVFTARVRGLPEAVARRRGGELLDRFGMSDRADVPVRGFSTGQRKRVALARALLHDPELLFLDEPTSGLDPAATREVVQLIGSLARDRGRTVVLCTHLLGEAGRLADRMAVLFAGRLQASGSPAEVGRRFWTGLEASVDLGRPADQVVLDVIGAVAGVRSAVPLGTGVGVVLDDREVLPRMIAALVAREVPVYAAVPREPTLEDVYFAVERQAAEQPVTSEAPAA